MMLTSSATSSRRGSPSAIWSGSGRPASRPCNLLRGEICRLPAGAGQMCYINPSNIGETNMMNQSMSGDVTSDDKLWAALAYVFTPIVPIIILLMADKKDRPFIKAHNFQALVWGVAFYVIVTITSFFVIGICI